MSEKGFYTSIVERGDRFLVRGYDGSGRRFARRVEARPVLYVPARDRPPSMAMRDMFGVPLAVMTFDGLRAAKDYVKKYDGVGGFRLYGLPRFQYAYLDGEYPGEVAYDVDMIRIATLDIETDSSDGYPDVTKADKEIISLVLSRRWTGRKLAFGLKPWGGMDGVDYVECDSEVDLLEKFLSEWGADYPDVVTGWNVQLFDVNYLARRIEGVLGPSDAARLSPWGFLTNRRAVTMFMGEQEAVSIPGVQVLDYWEMYKKLTYTQRESYKLDDIARVELGDAKIAYEDLGSLADMYEKDFDRHMRYNCKDTDIVDRLDDKMGLLELVFALAYDAKVNYQDVYSQVKMWDVLIANHLRAKRIQVPTYGGGRKDQAYAGAHVKDPQVGAHDWVVSVDLASLYPHLIMQYNLSPETIVKRAKVDVTVDFLLDASSDEIPLRGDHSLAANGVYFSNEKQGFLAEMMERLYKSRSDLKARMLESLAAVEAAKASGDKDAERRHAKDAARYKNAQMARKIQLNSAYGAIGNPAFRFFDVDIATAITVGGQLSIRWAERRVNAALHKILGRDATSSADYVIAADTDSLYLNLSAVVERTFPAGDVATDDDKCAALDAFVKRFLEPELDRLFTDLAERQGAFGQRMQMKREAIARRGIWTAKKRYLLDVLDNEGVRYAKPKMKATGLEVVKSSTPQSCRDALNVAMEIALRGTQEQMWAHVEKFRAAFSAQPFEDVAFPRTVKDISKYDGDPKGVPIHARGAIVYNRMLAKRGLDNRFPTVRDGDKIRFAYLRVPNPTMGNVIASPGPLPAEMGVAGYIDYDLQFEKAFLDPLNLVLGAIGWKAEHANDLSGLFA